MSDPAHFYNPLYNRIKALTRIMTSRKQATMSKCIESLTSTARLRNRPATTLTVGYRNSSYHSFCANLRVYSFTVSRILDTPPPSDPDGNLFSNELPLSTTDALLGSISMSSSSGSSEESRKARGLYRLDFAELGGVLSSRVFIVKRALLPRTGWATPCDAVPPEVDKPDRDDEGRGSFLIGVEGREAE